MILMRSLYVTFRLEIMTVTLIFTIFVLNSIWKLHLVKPHDDRQPALLLLQFLMRFMRLLPQDKIYLPYSHFLCRRTQPSFHHYYPSYIRPLLLKWHQLNFISILLIHFHKSTINISQFYPLFPILWQDPLRSRICIVFFDLLNYT